MANIVDNSDCPFKCVNGKVFDTTVRHEVPCPHCGDKYKAIADGKVTSDDGRTFEEILAIPSNYKVSEYSIEKTIPDLNKMTDRSKETVERFLKATFNQAVLGETPKCSFYVNLGMRANILNYLYTYLKYCFKNSLTVTPVVSTTDLVALRTSAEGTETKASKLVEKNLGIVYQELEIADICVVTLDAGVSKSGVYAVKGLLEARDRRGLPTLVFTNAFLYSDLRAQIIAQDKTQCYHLLYPVEVEYIKVNEEQSESLVETDAKVYNNTNKPVGNSNTGQQKTTTGGEVTQKELMSIISATNLGSQNSL